MGRHGRDGRVGKDYDINDDMRTRPEKAFYEALRSLTIDSRLGT